MFVTQINSIEAQIEELTAKRDQYRSLENELAVAMEAIARIKQTALALDPEIADEVVQELSRSIGGVTVPAQDALDKLSISESLVENLQPVEEEPEATEETTNRYESAAEIAEALADIDEVDACLMAIASMLDACPATEVPGRVWFFVQNISADFDDRILGYLPKSLRAQWDKERTASEQEARASIFPEVSAPKTIFEVGDFVQDHTGQLCEVVQAEDIGGRAYVEIKSPKGKETYRDTDLKLIGKAESEPIEAESQGWVNLVDDEDEYELGVGDDWEESIEEAIETLDPVVEPREEFEVHDIVQIPSGEIVTVQSIDFVGADASYTLRMPNGKNQSGFKAFELKKTGKFQQPATCKVGSLVQCPDGRTGQVIYFATTLMGEEQVAVEFAIPKKKKITEHFLIGSVTVVEEEPETISVPKDKNVGRWVDCPDGKTGRIIKTSKKGRWIEATVQFRDGSTRDYDVNSLWLLPHDEMIDSKVRTPDGGIGIVSMVEPGRPDMLVVEFLKGSAPYFKKDLVIIGDDQELTALPNPHAA